MNKTLREKLIRKHEEMKDSMPSLYNMRWVEKAATDGWNQLIKDMEKTEPKLAEAARSQKGYNVLAVTVSPASRTRSTRSSPSAWMTLSPLSASVWTSFRK